MKDKLQIRDFIYLDVERMKSIFSQIYEGVSESSVEEKGRQKTVSADSEVSGGIPLLAKFKGEIGGEIIWENKESETKTLHDHMYNKIEQTLKNDKSIYFIDGTKDSIKKSWINGELGDQISDTSFLLIKGRIMIDDYVKFQKLVKNFNKIQESLSSLKDIPDDTEERELFKVVLRKNLRSQGKSFNEGIIENMLFIIQEFYQNELFIKVLPYSDNYYLRFIGNLNKEYLRESMESITFKYGTFPVSEWYVFGQVSSIFPKGYNQTKFFQDPKYEKIFQQAGNINTILKNIKKSGIEIKSNYDLDHLDLNKIKNVTPENIKFLKTLHLDKDDFRVLQDIGMDTILESVFNGFRVVDYIFSTKFPSVTFTPIAVYRGE